MMPRRCRAARLQILVALPVAEFDMMAIEDKGQLNGNSNIKNESESGNQNR